MSTLPKILQVSSSASLGVFAGAMLTEALVLLPYWRSLRAAEFLSWYAVHGARLQGFFGPLTWIAGLLSLVAAIVSLWAGDEGKVAATSAALLMLAAVATFFLYFERANGSFASGSIDLAALPAELGRWATWHGARTGLSLAAVGSALLALQPFR